VTRTPERPRAGRSDDELRRRRRDDEVAWARRHPHCADVATSSVLNPVDQLRRVERDLNPGDSGLVDA